MSFMVTMENLSDVSHFSFSHHGVTPSALLSALDAFSLRCAAMIALPRSPYDLVTVVALYYSPLARLLLCRT
jgi:hypothetical protein